MNYSELKKIAEKNRNLLLNLVKERLAYLGFFEENLETPSDLSENDNHVRELLLNRLDIDNYKTSYKTLTEELAVYWFNLINLIYFLIQTDTIKINSLFELLIDLRMNEISDNIKEYPPRKATLDKLNQYKEKFKEGLLELSEKLLFLNNDDLELLDFLFQSKEFSKNGVISTIFFSLINSSLTEHDYPLALGWLYQYFNKDRKDNIFRVLKTNQKISKETLASATLIYTPDWIVKYMVENTLGRLWINHLLLTDDNLSEEELAQKFNLNYYLPEESKLSEAEKEYYKNLNLEDLTFFDPAMGSGNILIYAFDLLLMFYQDQGVPINEAIKNIINNNLYGLDIDREALKLTTAALLLKARRYNDQLKFNLEAFPEFNHLNLEAVKKLISKMSDYEKSWVYLEINNLLMQFKDSRLLGSLLNPKIDNFNLLKAFLDSCLEEKDNDPVVLKELSSLLHLVKILTQKYDVVVTNPPYFGSRYLNKDLQNYILDSFTYKHKDLFSAFIEKDLNLTKEFGLMSMIIQPSLLSLQSLTDLRKGLIKNNSILSLLDMGRGNFGADFGSAAFTVRKNGKKDYKGKYFKLHEKLFTFIKIEDIESLFLNAKNDHNFKYDFNSYEHKQDDNHIDISNPEGDQIYFEKNQATFLNQPKTTMVYWISDNLSNHFKNDRPVQDFAEIKQGLATSDNNSFLRFWYEIDFNNINFNAQDLLDAENSGYKWFPYNKGGAYRKWYGNDEYVINWENNGGAIKKMIARKYKYLTNFNFVIKNQEYYFKPSLSWSTISSGLGSFRFKPAGFLFDVGGMSMFDENNLYYIGGLLNSIVGKSFLEVVNPTINFQKGDIAQIPLILDDQYKEEIEKLVKENIDITKEDWDMSELSWNFKKHPLIGNFKSLKEAYKVYEDRVNKNFERLKRNEERLNQIFIEIYDLPELDYKVPENIVSIKKADKVAAIKSLLSYFIGCLFGRYSLDSEGIVYSGGSLDKTQYSTYKPLDNAVIPLTLRDNELEDFDSFQIFEKDIIKLLENWLILVYGEESLEENLEFIADTIGYTIQESARDHIRHYFIRNFSTDHYSLYRRRPLYWEFNIDSNFNLKFLCLFSRLDESVKEEIINNINQYEKYLEKVIAANIVKRDQTKYKSQKKQYVKKVDSLRKSINNLRKYKEKINSLDSSNFDFDLDDGILINFNKFQTDSSGQNLKLLKNLSTIK